MQTVNNSLGIVGRNHLICAPGCLDKMVWILFTIGLSVQFAGCAFHQCQRKHLKISAKYEIQESDFKPLFTIEQNTSGALFHSCFNQCENFQHCIGLEICNVGESLYRCRGCCEWRKRKVYSSSPGSSKCTYFEKVSEMHVFM